MRNARIVTMATLVAIACCAGTTATALAEGGPLFAYEEGGQAYLLTKKSETLSGTVSGVGVQLLRVPASAAELISCNNLNFSSGSYLLGGTPGSGSGLVIFGNCSTPANPSCEVNSPGEPRGTIATLAVETELVYLEKSLAETLDPDRSGSLFRPQNASHTFAIIELKPSSSCPTGGSPAIKGEAIFENAEPLVHQTLHTESAPATAITKYFAGMTGKEEKIKKLEFAGIEVVGSGTVSLDATLLGGHTDLSSWLCP